MNKFRLFLALLLMVFTGYAFISYFAFHGTISGKLTNASQDVFMDPLKPDSRIQQDRIISEPVYVTLHPPRSFLGVDLTVEFMPDDNDVMEFGPIGNAPGNISLHPLYHSVIESLLRDSHWNRIEREGVTLFQKKSAYQFESIDRFLKSPPAYRDVSSYNFDYDWPLDSVSDALDEAPTQYDTLLQGSHRIRFVTSGDPVYWKFIFFSLQQKTDHLTIITRSGDNIISTLEQDLTDGKTEMILSLDHESVVPNILTLDVGTESQETSWMIETNVAQFAFDRHIRVAPGETAVSLKTTGRDVSAAILDYSGLQDIIVDEKTFSLLGTSIPVPIGTNADLRVHAVHMNKGGIQFDTHGSFFLDSSNIFFDGPLELIRDNSSEINEDYVISRYRSPQISPSNMFIQKYSFDASEVYFHDHAIRFAFSIPQVDESRPVTIGNIEYTMRFRPLGMSDIWKKLIDAL